MTVEEVETRVGEISVKALEKGGDELLDQVTDQLGVALRHLARIHDHKLTLVPGVVKEIEDSFTRAEKLLQ